MKSLIKIFILMILLFINISLFAKSTGFSIGIWNINSINGKIGLRGSYRSKEVTLRSGFSDYPKAIEYTGKFDLKTNSYLWHPNFLLLDFDLVYNPGSYKENFLVVPDRSDARTAERINLRATFFKNRPIFLTFFSNYGHSFVNREFTSNLESKSFSWGGLCSYRNKTLPFTLNYTESKSDQIELSTSRKYIDNQNSFASHFNKIFKLNDHNLNFSYSLNQRTYYSNVSISSKDISAILNSRFFANENKNYAWGVSNIAFFSTSGIQNLRRINANENINIKLPEKFNASLNYNFTRTDQFNRNADLSTTLNQHDVITRLTHQLYLSLYSYMSYQLTDYRHTDFDESRNIGNIGFKYKKIIPTGLLKLNYDFTGRLEKRNGYSEPIIISNEEYILTDMETILLKNPDVVQGSIVITDETKTNIYQENIDYVVIRRGNFVEIQRLPGGQIENGQTVYIDYISEYNDSYTYNSFSHSFGGSITLFDNLLKIYMNGIEQSFANVKGKDLSTLKLISERKYGCKLSFGYLSCGLEYEDYETNIIPYNFLRYFVMLNRKFGKSFLAQITANFKNQELTKSNEKQKFADISGKIQYLFTKKIKFTMDGGYRFQEGRGLDLKLLTLRTEISILYRKMNIRLGVENFNRTFSKEEITNYISGFIKIERQF